MAKEGQGKAAAEAGVVENLVGNLLVVVLDVNPDQRLFFGKSQGRVAQWLNACLGLVNSHLMLHPSNEAAVVGVSKGACQFLYPDQEDQSKQQVSGRHPDGQYEGFRLVETTIRKNAMAMMKKELQRPNIGIDSLVAGGLCMALSYINRQQKESDAAGMATGSNPDAGGQEGGSKGTQLHINARILVMTASGATASQYMNYMNAFFTAQKMNIPVDTCIMDRESGLLQQGADITGGLYLKVPNLDNLFQFLVWVFLPEVTSTVAGQEGLRGQLGLPSSAKVDYRAACFCHRQLVDIGYVCSVCLSIFCKFSPICTTCQTVFKVPNVLPNMLKKKKKT